jgi:phosphatidylglycerol---prolipoprotein diacylglyceryl transferase
MDENGGDIEEILYFRAKSLLMIAFTIFWRPIYRYGIAYAVTFLSGYIWLQRVANGIYIRHFPRIQSYLRDSLDDFVILIILAILLGGRLGHVFLYERSYYSQHLEQILAFHQGGMAFLWWVIGVVCMLIYIIYKNRFSRGELKVLGDLILCIVPLGIFLGRIANFLNQELIGKSIVTFPILFQQIAGFLWLVHIYTLVDMIPRFNVNITQAVLEGLVPLVVGQIIIIFKPSRPPFSGRGGTSTWTITAFFFIRYGMVRFLIEFCRDIPIYEYIYMLSVSQRLSLWLIGAGICISYKK